MPAAKVPCPRCRVNLINVYSKTCWDCHVRGIKGRRSQRIEAATAAIREQAKVAPEMNGPEHIECPDGFIVITDPHIPFHSPDGFRRVLEVQELLGISTLIIGGDLIHADRISKYDCAGPTVPIAAEIVACARVLRVLEDIFDHIEIIVGNHDQRMEKLISKMMSTSDGRNALEIVSAALDIGESAEEVAYGLLGHFFNSPKVRLHRLPKLTVNDRWVVIHPGQCSRVSPQTERGLSQKYRMSVIGGHNHLFGVGFDNSGQDVAFNAGHLADTTKWRYQQEKPTSFPAQVPAFGVVLCDPEQPQGRLIPLAIHDKWFDLTKLYERLKWQESRRAGGA